MWRATASVRDSYLCRKLISVPFWLNENRITLKSTAVLWYGLCPLNNLRIGRKGPVYTIFSEEKVRWLKFGWRCEKTGQRPCRDTRLILPLSYEPQLLEFTTYTVSTEPYLIERFSSEYLNQGNAPLAKWLEGQLHQLGFSFRLPQIFLYRMLSSTSYRMQPSHGVFNNHNKIRWELHR